ncbi:MAG: hypothetical protein ABFR82_12785 [Nitrospirota bacterium]
MPIRVSGGLSGSSGEGDTMTAKETIGIISNSSLWKILSRKERLEAIAYTMALTGSEPDDEDVSDLIGEVYAD